MTRTRHETEASLHAFAEGTTAAAEGERVAAHLAACPRCRRTVGEYRALGASLRAGAAAADTAFESAAWSKPGPLERALGGARAATPGLRKRSPSFPFGGQRLKGEKFMSHGSENVARRPQAPSLHPWKWTTGLAAAFLLGGLSGAWFSQGKLSAGKSVEEQAATDMADLNKALVMYAQDWDEVMPPATDSSGVRERLKNYLRDIRNPKKPPVEPPPAPPLDPSVFRQPGTHLPYQTNPALLRVHRKRIARPGQTVTFYEARPAPDGTRAVAFLDGSVRRIPESQWKQVLRLSDAQTRRAAREGKPIPKVRGANRKRK